MSKRMILTKLTAIWTGAVVIPTVVAFGTIALLTLLFWNDQDNMGLQYIWVVPVVALTVLILAPVLCYRFVYSKDLRKPAIATGLTIVFGIILSTWFLLTFSDAAFAWIEPLLSAPLAYLITAKVGGKKVVDP